MIQEAQRSRHRVTVSTRIHEGTSGPAPYLTGSQHIVTIKAYV